MSRSDVKRGAVSVVIPCYRDTRYLGEAIESVLAQRPSASEIVVVDDGSPNGDEIAAVVARHPGVRYVRAAHGGLPAARNNGVRATSGEFLVFLDADDWLLPGAIEAGLEALSANPDCAFSYGLGQWWLDGEVGDLEVWGVSGNLYPHILRKNAMGGVHSLMHRRAALDSVGGFDESYRWCEDWELYMRLTRRYPAVFHGRYCSRVRRRPDSHSATNNAAMLATSHRALVAQWPHVRGNPELEEALRFGIFWVRWIYGERLAGEIREAVRARRLGEVARKLPVLLRHHPREAFVQLGRKLRATVAG